MGNRTAQQQAQQQNRQLTNSHYENFTVMSALLPRHLRQDVANLYAYCRTVDDLGDVAAGSRLPLLAAWQRDLERCWSGTPSDPVLLALQSTIMKHQLPQEPFLRLVVANQRDQVQHRYETWDDLIDYCTYSANPVGRLYLHLLGYTDHERQALADATCTALQLVNFWQDISCDAQMGRIYVPRDILAQFGVAESAVLEGHDSLAAANMVAELCNRTATLFDQGLRLLELLPPRHAYNVRLFSLGGMAILSVVEKERMHILTHRPTLRRQDKWHLALQALWPWQRLQAPRIPLTTPERGM